VETLIGRGLISGTVKEHQTITLDLEDRHLKIL
jgi:hypothetical protein